MSYQANSSSSKLPLRTQNPNWDRIDQEEELLNDIEAATKRIYNQVHNIFSEAMRIQLMKETEKGSVVVDMISLMQIARDKHN